MAGAIDFKGIGKYYGHHKALDQVSFEVQQGELICILGPSGCGKSTLLRVVAGIESFQEGQLLLNGKNAAPLKISERQLGIVFQSYALFPNLTVTQNIGYGLKTSFLGKNARKDNSEIINELLDLVHLTGKDQRYPHQLSGGEQQRVALARALAVKPQLLLLDEPLSALDAKVRLMLRQEIVTLQRKLKLTTLMVTHDQEEALTMADRIVVMNHGKVEQVGTPLEIYKKPATQFVADFVGAVNFLKDKQAIIRPELIKVKSMGIHSRSIDVSATESIQKNGSVPSVSSHQEIYTVKVEQMLYHGAFYRVHALDANRQTWLVDVPSDQLLQMGITEGSSIQLEVSREDVVSVA